MIICHIDPPMGPFRAHGRLEMENIKSIGALFGPQDILGQKGPLDAYKCELYTIRSQMLYNSGSNGGPFSKVVFKS